jgi:hypothetical protein
VYSLDTGFTLLAVTCESFEVEDKKKFTSTLYPGGIRSHESSLQSPRWQAETIPLDDAATARDGHTHQYVTKAIRFFHALFAQHVSTLNWALFRCWLQLNCNCNLKRSNVNLYIHILFYCVSEPLHTANNCIHFYFKKFHVILGLNFKCNPKIYIKLGHKLLARSEVS